MQNTSNYLAFDLGAESGRAIVGSLSGDTMQLETIHRFPNGPVQVFDSLYWDVLRLFAEMKEGLAIYRRDYGTELDGIGLDTWGVDFGLLGRNDVLLGIPHNYRDARTEGMMEAAFRVVSPDLIFERTGIQFMEINTLYQLLAMRLRDDPLLDQAQTFLMIPDLFNFWFTGEKRCEFSDATTTQFFDPRQRTWSRELLDKLELPTDIYPAIIEPGTVLGGLRQQFTEPIGLEGTPVIAPACHDTGSAVAAVPAQGKDFCYISSGTWSLMGIETAEPVITPESRNYNFTNEGGVAGTFRLLKNIMGLWLVQQCRSHWASEGQDLSYTEITQMAADAPAFGPLVDPDFGEFLRPGDMPSRIRDYCARTEQPVPQTKGEVVRCALESLALRYRWVLEKLEIMRGRPIDVIHVVGGGSQNRLLLQFAADATQRPVVAGPIEATAAGNILMQALARGRISSIAEGREIIRRSFPVETIEPGSASGWDDAYGRFLKLVS